MGLWPGCFLAALFWLVTHGLIAWLVVKGGPGGWAYAVLECSLVGWVGLYLWFLVGRIRFLSSVERLSAGQQLGTMLGCAALVSRQIWIFGLDVLPIFPPMTVVHGLGLFAHGATYWGRFYLAGAVLLMIGCGLPLVSPFLWPVVHEVALAGVLVWTGVWLHRFDREGNPHGV